MLKFDIRQFLAGGYMISPIAGTRDVSLSFDNSCNCLCGCPRPLDADDLVYVNSAFQIERFRASKDRTHEATIRSIRHLRTYALAKAQLQSKNVHTIAESVRASVTLDGEALTLRKVQQFATRIDEIIAST